MEMSAQLGLVALFYFQPQMAQIPEEVVWWDSTWHISDLIFERSYLNA